MFPRARSFQGCRSRRLVVVLVAVCALPIGMVCLGWKSRQDKADKADKGVTYHHETVASQPWSIHIARIDRSRRDLVLRSTWSRDSASGLRTLTEQVTSLPAAAGRPVVAVNGDFYITEERNPYVGDPRGLQIIDGELVSAPTDQASFWIDTRGQPQATNVISGLKVIWPDGSSLPLGLNEERRAGASVLYTARMASSTRTRGGREWILERTGTGPWLPLRAGQTYTARVREVRTPGNSPLSNDVMVLSIAPGLMTQPMMTNTGAGAIVTVSTATIPDLTGVQMAISGGYVLVRNGRQEQLEIPQSGAYKYRSVGERHPRSAIGASRDHIFLVEVDGRQPNLSMGMTLAELGQYMHKLGCDLVMNLDGGASATFWMEGRVLNNPCSRFERPIANGIVVLQKEPAPGASPAPAR